MNSGHEREENNSKEKKRKVKEAHENGGSYPKKD